MQQLTHPSQKNLIETVISLFHSKSRFRADVSFTCGSDVSFGCGGVQEFTGVANVFSWSRNTHYVETKPLECLFEEASYWIPRPEQPLQLLWSRTRHQQCTHANTSNVTLISYNGQ